ncbi:MAG: hypothetical protein CMJ49_03500 [Planctomycetaceae bacterium]|nr:hypothetical protein [Planctomycetaceae bacterium]
MGERDARTLEDGARRAASGVSVERGGLESWVGGEADLVGGELWIEDVGAEIGSGGDVAAQGEAERAIVRGGWLGLRGWA